MNEIIGLGRGNKELNHQPKSINVFNIITHASEEDFTLRGVKKVLYQGFKDMNLAYYDTTIKSALKARPESNTRYEIIQQAAQFIWQNYQDILIYKIPQVDKRLIKLKTLVYYNLFWDPIIKIQKIKSCN